MTLDEQIDFLDSAGWHALSPDAQEAYLKALYQQFRRELPDDPDLPQISLLVAGCIDKIRREARVGIKKV